MELGAEDYSATGRLNGEVSAAIVIFQSPGSNAIATADRVEKLLEVIREDSAYQRYLACEEMLKSNPELKKQIDEFRVAVFHMNNDDTQGDLYDITDEVENRYEKLRKVPEVNAYLEAELDVCRMLQQVQEQFRNGIDLNIPNV